MLSPHQSFEDHFSTASQCWRKANPWCFHVHGATSTEAHAALFWSTNNHWWPCWFINSSSKHFKLFKLQSSKKTKNTPTIDWLPYSLSKRSIKKSFRINSWPSARQATCCQSLLAYQSLLHHRIMARWAKNARFGITVVSHSSRLRNSGLLS